MRIVRGLPLFRHVFSAQPNRYAVNGGDKLDIPFRAEVPQCIRLGFTIRHDTAKLSEKSSRVESDVSTPL